MHANSARAPILIMLVTSGHSIRDACALLYTGAIVRLDLLAAFVGIALQSAAPAPRVAIETELGTITIAVDVAHAPGTSANFLKYVNEKFYDGGRFHRTVRLSNQPGQTVKIEVVQAGANPSRERDGFPPIALERTGTTGLRHLDGVVSMARDGPDTATSDFFICIGDQPSLDQGGRRNPDGQGFAAFGRVVSGMEVVRAIQASPADGQHLTPPVMIRSVRRSP
jgi:peptidyl-prolyl cis-trans isomerase A (cyclophilin A)